MPSLNYLKANCEHLLACLRQRLGVGERSILNCYLINSDNILCFLHRVHLLFLQIGLDWLSQPAEATQQGIFQTPVERRDRQGQEPSGPCSPAGPKETRSERQDGVVGKALDQEISQGCVAWGEPL